MVRKQQIVSFIALIALLLSIVLGTTFISQPHITQAASIPPMSEFPTTGTVDGITSGPDGNLWFTDNAADKIGSITTSGAVTEYPLSQSLFSTPGGITSGPDGNLWFTDHASNRIGVVSPSSLSERRRCRAPVSNGRLYA